MPATKVRPEYWAALLVAGMLSAMIFFGGIGNGNAIIYITWLLSGKDIIMEAKKTGCLHPYPKKFALKNIKQQRFALIFLTWALAMIYLTARFWFPIARSMFI